MSCCAKPDEGPEIGGIMKAPRTPSGGAPRIPSTPGEEAADRAGSTAPPETTNAQREAKLRERLNAIKVAQLTLELAEQQKTMDAAGQQEAIKT